MLPALSADLRERVVTMIEGGASRRQAARRFAVSPASAVHLHRFAITERAFDEDEPVKASKLRKKRTGRRRQLFRLRPDGVTRR